MAKNVLFSKTFLGWLLSLLTLCTLVLTRQGTPLLFLGWALYLMYHSSLSLSTLLKMYGQEVKRPHFLALVTLGLYAGLSTLWSQDPAMTTRESIGIMGLMLSLPLIPVMAQLKSWPSKIVQNGLIIFLIGLLALSFQTLTDIKLRSLVGLQVKTIKPNYELLSVFLIPLTISSILEKKLLSRIFMLTTYGLFFVLLDVKTAGVALLAFTLTWAISYALKAPRFLTYVFGTLTCLYNALLPVLFNVYTTAVRQDYFELPKIIRSFVHRLYIWEYSSSKIMEKPWLGWGAGITRTFMETESTSGNNLQLLPSHPHNYVLQLWLEMGVIGIGLFTLMQLFVLRAISKVQDSLHRSLYYGFYVFVFLLLSAAHSLWHKWWIFWIALCLTFIMKLMSSSKK